MEKKSWPLRGYWCSGHSFPVHQREVAKISKALWGEGMRGGRVLFDLQCKLLQMLIQSHTNTLSGFSREYFWEKVDTQTHRERHSGCAPLCGHSHFCCTNTLEAIKLRSIINSIEWSGGSHKACAKNSQKSLPRVCRKSEPTETWGKKWENKIWCSEKQSEQLSLEKAR